jgi:hypothetical protein
VKRTIRRHVKGFIRSVHTLEWFDWFWLSYVVFVGFLFRLAAEELMRMFSP